MRAVGGTKRYRVAVDHGREPAVARQQRGGYGRLLFPDERAVGGPQRDNRVVSGGKQQLRIGRERMRDLDLLAPPLLAVGEVVRGDLPGAKRDIDELIVAHRKGSGNRRRADVNRPAQRERQARPLGPHALRERQAAESQEQHAQQYRSATRYSGLNRPHTL